LFSIRAIEGTMSIHADGETMGIGSTEVSFECLSAPLRVVTVQPTS
jgi:diacylglycerol kinase family enzyme